MEDAEQLQLERRRRVKRVIVGLVSATVAVGVCLAIALPLTSNGSQTASVNKVSTLQSRPKASLGVPQSEISEKNTSNTTGQVLMQANNDHWPHFLTEEPNVTSTTTKPYIPYCSIVPQSKRGNVLIDFELIDGDVMFELARIQTYNSPAYAQKIVCSVVALNTTEEGVLTASAAWDEGEVGDRTHKSVHAELHAMESKNDWTITTTDPENIKGIKGQLSALAQIGVYLLTYQCYAEEQQAFNPGYVISVYSTRWQHDYNYKIVDSLLDRANRWGLNMNEDETEYIRHHGCHDYHNDS